MGNLEKIPSEFEHAARKLRNDSFLLLLLAVCNKEDKWVLAKKMVTFGKQNFFLYSMLVSYMTRGAKGRMV